MSHAGSTLPSSTAPAAPSSSEGASVASAIEYEKLLDCVHCGLCTASCPTYLELGNENDSPRGRIYLMRGVTDGRLELSPPVRRHLELCLDCRACETACPSGVQYGRLIEPFRIAMESAGEITDRKTNDWFHRWILFGLFTRPDRLRRALLPARIAQWLRIDRLVEMTGIWKLLPPRLGRMLTLLPPLERPQPVLPAVTPAKGRRRARVALFTGCVGDVVFRSTHWATLRVLQENGCDVVIPAEQQCCGAIHFHAGHSDPARALADANVNALRPGDVDAILVNVAGCGSMLKEYGHHWHDARQSDRQEFANKVRDVHEFLDDLGLIAPRGPLPITATYHDACHLAHAQRVREAPRRLLQRIPGLQLVELTESEICCGAAGTYNLTEPEMADRLAKRKLQHIRDTGARVVATANAGCLLQIAREARMQGEVLKLMHPLELLDLSYRNESLTF